jgi:molybdopterin/thiamine biosynthesis adenylyltransferase
LVKRLSDRYNRQVIMPEIGDSGQRKISKATAVIVGMGGLGSAIANNLTRAGVGKLVIIDRDIVELSNLQRQMLYTECDLGKPKTVAAAEFLKKVNSDTEIIPFIIDLNFSNVETIIKGADVLVDGTDNMATRYLINDACVKNNIPWVYGGAVRTYGMTMNIIPNKTACLRCMLPDILPIGMLPTCDTTGILTEIPQVIASIESAEAIKIIVGSDKISKTLINYDCKCCGKREFEYLNLKRDAQVTTLCGSKTIQITPMTKGNISLKDLAERLNRVGNVSLTEYTLVFKLFPIEITIFSDGRTMVKGAKDEKNAKSFYAKYIGT